MAVLKLGLDAHDFERTTDRMREFFKKYCLCIPAMSRDRWLAPSAKSKFKPSWIGFDGHGDRMDYPDEADGCGGKYGSTWHREARIEEEYCWDVSCEEATSQEGLRQGAQAHRDAVRRYNN